MNKNRWYDQHIEEPVRKAVKALRNEGINTESSCGHDMTIQCQFLDNSELDRIYNVLILLGYDNYCVSIFDDVNEGHRSTTLEIMLPDINGRYYFDLTENKEFIKKIF